MAHAIKSIMLYTYDENVTITRWKEWNIFDKSIIKSNFRNVQQVYSIMISIAIQLDSYFPTNSNWLDTYA